MIDTWENEGGGLEYDPHRCYVCRRQPNATEPWCSETYNVGWICFKCGYLDRR